MTPRQAWEDGMLRHLAANVPEARPLCLAAADLWPLMNEETGQFAIGEWLRHHVLGTIPYAPRLEVDWTVGGEATRAGRARIAQVWNDKMPHDCTHAAWDNFIAKHGRRPRE